MSGTDENHTFQGVVVPEHLQKRAPATNLGLKAEVAHRFCDNNFAAWFQG